MKSKKFAALCLLLFVAATFSARATMVISPWIPIYKGVERAVRNSLWQGRSQQSFYDALQWLYGWNADNCMSGITL